MQWVNVIDRMPDVDLFLAYSVFGDVETISRRNGFVIAKNNEFLGWDESFVEGFANWGGRPVRFTHWMPLPEPPTASNNELKATKAP